MLESKHEADSDLLKDAAVRALGKILELAESDISDIKLKYDICKWICEMHFGKPGSALQKSDGSNMPLVLSFKGELEKWSK